MVTTLARESSASFSSDSGGQYVLERTLGTGGQGDVFVAWDTLLFWPVALKWLRRCRPQTATSL
jgi:hypothetical protein